MVFSYAFRARQSALFSFGLLAALLALGMPAVSARAEDTAYIARVSYIFDGDTLWVLPVDGGRSRKLRLEGIDAPEICQSGGVASRDALRERLSGQTVTVQEHERDTYGRPLVDLKLGSEDVATWMVRQGWAWSYRWHDDPGPFARQEAQARAAKRGIFADRMVEEPRAFRRRNGHCPRP